jgi:uracil-DNA glycosylase family 4
VIIGEAPGRWEDQQGKPFVGQTGILMERWMRAAGINPIEAYYDNVVPFMPPQGRLSNLSYQEIEYYAHDVLSRLEKWQRQTLHQEE